MLITLCYPLHYLVMYLYYMYVVNKLIEYFAKHVSLKSRLISLKTRQVDNLALLVSIAVKELINN
jgi:hypothetical protein